MVLIQLLLPAAPDGADAQAAVVETRRELVDAFGGITAYVRTPAEGVWTSPDGQREGDAMLMVEVVAPRFDRAWWRDYADRLAHRFRQQAIHVRALAIELLDPDAA